VIRQTTQQQRCVSMRTNQRVSAPWCSQLSWFDHLLGSSAQLTVARDAPRERCWPQSHWESGACRFINSNLIMFSVRRNASSYPFQSAVRLVTNGKNSAFTIAGRLRRQRSVRSAIRAEKKERSELARLWLTGITGLIGSHRLAGGHSGPSVASYNIFTLNHPSHHSRRYVSKSSTSRPHR